MKASVTYSDATPAPAVVRTSSCMNSCMDLYSSHKGRRLDSSHAAKGDDNGLGTTWGLSGLC